MGHCRDAVTHFKDVVAHRGHVVIQQGGMVAHRCEGSLVEMWCLINKMSWLIGEMFPRCYVIF